MKTRNYCLLITILLGCFSMSFGQNANGCTSGLRGGTSDYYTDCWTDTGDDTTRLQAALTASAGSRLVFTESNYSINNPLTVVSHNYLVGAGPAEAAAGATKSLIVLNSSGANASSLKTIFFIGEGEREITIKDLGLESGSGQTFTSGITASDEGGAPHYSTGGVHIQNIWFKDFTIGVHINPTGYNLWQFDSSSITNSSFEECGTAIYVEAIGGLEIRNISIYSPGTDQNGIWIEAGGYIEMDYIVGNAPKSGDTRPANEFIHIGSHGVTSIRNSSSEFYKKELVINDGSGQKVTAPVSLIANAFEGCPYLDGEDLVQTVEIHDAVVVSTGNEWTCNLLDEDEEEDTQIGPTRPQILGTADVVSIGDRFCKWGSIWCFPQGGYLGSEFSVEGGTSTLTNINMTNYNGSDSPMLDIVSGFGGKRLLELGNSVNFGGGTILKYKYYFTRNPSDHWLEVEGNLDPPNAGYRFKKGPVQVASVAQSSLSTHSSALAGSMLYCNNCTPNTSPCSTAGAGGGALAVKVNSGNWTCQ